MTRHTQHSSPPQPLRNSRLGARHLLWLLVGAAGALTLVLSAGASAPAVSPGASGTTAAGTSERAARPDFQMPLSCGTAWQLNTYDSGHNPALDIVVKGNTGSDAKPVLAGAAGTVSYTGKDTGAGNIIQVDHGGGWFSAYYHLKDAATAYVRVGDQVEAATQIGRIGATGSNSGNWSHLHYEQRYRSSGSGPTDEGDRVPVVLNGTQYTGVGREWSSVTSQNCSAWANCPETYVCFYSGPNGTGTVCRSAGNSGATGCGLRRSYFNNGSEEPGYDHVQVSFAEGGGMCLHRGWEEGRGNFPGDGKTITSWRWRGECS
ncbi:peptidoglycan DD-metalloendopeptidase family protein [Streptomyces sp. NPDC050439]|uniref:peptidoglycan DD-metalloendopeptidase family protein n=1 Tax=unclassified Streptomyces TaxID=2593676 RepID=UPI003431CC5A